MSWTNISFLIVFVLFSLSCSDGDKNENSIAGNEALQYLDKALERSGTIERWNRITKLSFVKKTRMFLPDSTRELELLQRQTYVLYPEFRGEIEYLFDAQQRKIIQEGSEVSYYEKGERVMDEEKIQQAATNIRTQFYVIGLPFKLKDEGPDIKSITMEPLADGRIVNSLYLEQRKSLGNEKDENWWIYFNKETDHMIGYLIEHDNRFSYILNDSTKIVNEFPFPLERRSIAMDNNKENIFLRADYKYSEIEINLHKE